jgi:hypothetical protein
MTKKAMEEVEKYTAELADTLPKDVCYIVNSDDGPHMAETLAPIEGEIFDIILPGLIQFNDSAAA